ncbi:MAG: acyltransferase, partial [Verrucomicrobiota bacterium]
MSSNQQNRRIDIQLLRALAVLAVIVFHYQPSLLPGGYLGVDVFFVISGFLITGIILRAKEDGTFSLWQFYSRRILRILPALSIVLLVCLLLGIVAFPPRQFQALFEHLPWSFAQIANLSFMRGTGYFGADSNESAVL